MRHSLFIVLLWLFGWLAPAGAQADGLALDHGELALSAWSAEDFDLWRQAVRHASPEANEGHNLKLPAKLLPPQDDAAWKAVALPDARAGWVSTATPALFHMRWYRWRLAATTSPAALYLPSVAAAAPALLVRTEQGWQLWQAPSRPGSPYWPQSLWTDLPREAAEVVLAVPVPAGGRYAVSRAWVGPPEVLEPQWRRRLWLQQGLPQAISFTIAVLGLLSLALWVKLRSEHGYLWFALGASLWLIRNLHHYVDPPMAGTGSEWFWWLTHISLAWIQLLVFVFALRFVRERPERLLRGLSQAVLAASLLSLPFWLKQTDRVLLQYLITAVVALVSAVYLNLLGWRQPPGPGRSELRIIGGGLALGLLMGGHDFISLAGWAWPEDIYLMPLAALVVMLSLLYAVQRRYAGRVEQALFQNSQLQQSLDVQADALALQVKRLREAERQQALLLERQRLMADMHDGLGSSLLSALVAVEQGNLSQDKVVEVLRECVDDLRLVIDSLEPVGHDLVSLLATMRYRLGKRLHAGGLSLEWDVQDLPILPWLEPPDALHVLRLMQEALNNVVKHAGASRVRMVTRDHGSYVEIRVEDDGAGFDVQTVRHGRGLKSQIKRAQRLGGKLRVESTPGLGTRLSLRLPVERKEPPAQQAAG